MTTSSAPSSIQPAVSFAEIRSIVGVLPALEPVPLPDLSSLGRLGEWILFLGRAQGKQPELRHVRLAIFAGAHGCVSDSAARTAGLLHQLTLVTHPVARVLQQTDADLRVYELDLDHPTQDFRVGPALSEENAAHAMAYGMMAAEPGVQLLALAARGEGGEQAVQALLRALPSAADPLQALAAFGGLECCAMLGSIIAARLARVPVLLDGLVAESAAAVLAHLSPGAVSHTLSAQALEPDIRGEPGLAAAIGMGRLKTLVAAL